MNKVPSIVQILVAELLAVWGLSWFVMAVWNTIKPGAFGAMSLRGIGNWVWFLIGMALLVWLLREILRPRVKKDSWVSLKTGATSGGSYGFCSTHPSYFFVDLLPVTVSGFLFWYARGEGLDAKNYSVMLAISLVFPALRLLSWYVLGLKIADAAETQKAWKPAAFVFVPFLVSFAAVGIAVAIGTRQHQNEIANMPIVDEQSFRNGREAFAHLVDNSQTEKQTGFVRLHAKQIGDGPNKCKNDQDTDFATVLADLGAGGDVLIVGSKYDRSGFDELVNKSTGNKGREIEVVGKLRELPRASAIEKWKAYCGIDKLPSAPAGGRWVLEMREP